MGDAERATAGTELPRLRRQLNASVVSRGSEVHVPRTTPPYPSSSTARRSVGRSWATRSWSRTWGSPTSRCTTGSSRRRRSGDQRPGGLSQDERKEPARLRDENARLRNCQRPSTSPEPRPSFSPAAAMISPHWWPAFLPTSGCRWGVQVRGFTPLPAVACASQVLPWRSVIRTWDVMKEPVDGCGRGALGHQLVEPRWVDVGADRDRFS
jgi:hypothetical protein